MAALPHRPKGPPNNRTQGNGLDIAGTAKKNKNKKSKVVHDWELYIIDDSLEQNWERFLHDLGLGDFKSKKQCQKALQDKWINIYDFLHAVKVRNAAAESIKDEAERIAALKKPVDTKDMFKTSQKALARYTRSTGKIYPRDRVPNESPLRLLLTRIGSRGR